MVPGRKVKGYVKIAQGNQRPPSTTMSPTKLHFLPSLIKFLGPLRCLLLGFPDLVICSLAGERNIKEHSAGGLAQSTALQSQGHWEAAWRSGLKLGPQGLGYWAEYRGLRPRCYSGLIPQGQGNWRRMSLPWLQHRSVPPRPEKAGGRAQLKIHIKKERGENEVGLDDGVLLQKSTSEKPQAGKKADISR